MPARPHKDMLSRIVVLVGRQQASKPPVSLSFSRVRILLLISIFIFIFTFYFYFHFRKTLDSAPTVPSILSILSNTCTCICKWQASFANATQLNYWYLQSTVN